MKPPGNWSRRLAVVVVPLVAALMVIAMMPLPARADTAFRKKKTPSAESSGSEASPSGGEPTGEIGNAPATEGGEAAAPPPKTEYVPQAEDRDRPRDPSLLAKTPADAAVEKKAKKAEEPPIYTKWQFWALTGGIILVGVGALWAGSKIVHEMNGGDVRACNPDFGNACYGEGH